MLAKALQREFEVELVGPDLGEGVWTPLAQDKSVPYHSVELEKGSKSFAQLRKLYKKIDGDILYAQKPVLQTFGVGILKKHFDKVPLILDLDDWEWGEKKAQYNDLYASRARFLMRTFLGSDAFITYTHALLQGYLTPYADAITVSSSFLQRKFGGETIYQALDTSFYDPGRFDRQSIIAKLGIKESEKVVMFSGHPGPHKGVDDLVAAVSRIKDVNVKLVVVGINDSEYLSSFGSRGQQDAGREILRIANATVPSSDRVFINRGRSGHPAEA